MESSYHGLTGTVCVEYISDDLRGGKRPRVILSFLDYGSNLLCVRVTKLKDSFFRGTILTCWSLVLVPQQTCYDGNLQAHHEHCTGSTASIVEDRVPFNHSKC